MRMLLCELGKTATDGQATDALQRFRDSMEKTITLL
ncbi:hypothetical protein DM49_3553 [Burkholderia mallei]|nr:hypothetical protein DM49_3553 [Burkholderia mallei]